MTAVTNDAIECEVTFDANYGISIHCRDIPVHASGSEISLLQKKSFGTTALIGRGAGNDSFVNNA